jgi:hypothetical protein
MAVIERKIANAVSIRAKQTVSTFTAQGAKMRLSMLFLQFVHNVFDPSEDAKDFFNVHVRLLCVTYV